MTKQQRLKKLLQGCTGCTYDEAEGGLHCHCRVCQYEITKLTYEIVIDDQKEFELESHNGLTKAQEEMFQITEEECGELIQAISKVRRFGASTISCKTGLPYGENLIEECGDVIACIAVLSHNGLIPIDVVNRGARTKLDRIKDPSTRKVLFITPEMVP